MPSSDTIPKITCNKKSSGTVRNNFRNGDTGRANGRSQRSLVCPKSRTEQLRSPRTRLNNTRMAQLTL